MGQFHFDPDSYLELMRKEIPAYERLQQEVTLATEGLDAVRILELGTGTGETARRVLQMHPEAELVGIDSGKEMLERARSILRGADLRLGRFEDRLPDGPFDLAFSALAVHHLDADGKADLFRRLAERLTPRGRFVLGDLIVPADPEDAIAPVDNEYDVPSTIEEQLAWLTDAGFEPHVRWVERDLAVLVGDLTFR